MHTNDTSISKGCVRDPWLCHVMKRNGKMWAVVGRTPLWAFDIQFEEFEAVTIYFFRSKIIYISWIHDIPYVSMTGKRKYQANLVFSSRESNLENRSVTLYLHICFKKSRSTNRRKKCIFLLHTFFLPPKSLSLKRSAFVLLGSGRAHQWFSPCKNNSPRFSHAIYLRSFFLSLSLISFPTATIECSSRARLEVG